MQLILLFYMYKIYIHFATNMNACAKPFLKQLRWLAKAKTEMKPEHWTKRGNLRSCTKLALRASWTHGLIAQLLRASERNSVVGSSNLTQANFRQLLLKILQWWMPYIYIYIYGILLMISNGKKAKLSPNDNNSTML